MFAVVMTADSRKKGTKMGNRILKESICRSEEIDSLSWFEEVLFYRLIVVCDDFGRFDGRTKIIKGTCFPLKSVTEKDIDKALNKLSAAGLVRVYQVQGRPYLQLVTWSVHQTIRNQKSKYPSEESSDLEKEKNNCNQLKTIENNCNQLQSIEDNCNQLQSIEDNCVFNPIQFESNSNLNPNVCSEQKHSEPSPEASAEPPIITLQLNTGEEYPIYNKDIEQWQELYPAVDILQQFRKMKGWIISHPKQRKTEGGILKFINRWLAREQDKGGIAYKATSEIKQTPVKQNRFCNYEQRNWDFAELERMERERLQGTDMG